MNFEKNQIQNFLSQKARMTVNISNVLYKCLYSILQSGNKITGNKLGKKGEFKDAAKYMLQVTNFKSYNVAYFKPTM